MFYTSWEKRLSRVSCWKHKETTINESGSHAIRWAMLDTNGTEHKDSELLFICNPKKDGSPGLVTAAYQGGRPCQV